MTYGFRNVSKIVGIDPGLKGALAFLTFDGELVAVEDMPTLGKDVNAFMLTNLIVGYGPVKHAIVERAQSMPKQGIAGAFNYGTGYGKILGVLAALHIPTVDYSTAWKVRARLSKDKNLSRKRATQRWPEMAEDFSLVKHDGRAEAALMADLWLIENPQRTKSKRPNRLVAD